MDCELIGPGGDFTEWDAFVERSPQGTLFCKSRWLRGTLGDSFAIAVCRDGTEICAGLPLPLKGQGRNVTVIRPPMTSTMGVLLRPPVAGRKYEKQLSDEMGWLVELEARLPRYRSLTITCHPTFVNWLPFYWAGYHQTTQYTYIYPSIRDHEGLLEELDHSKRKNLNKAAKEVGIDDAVTIDGLYDHHTATLKKQGATISYPRDYLRRIHAAAGEVGGAILRRAVDAKGAVHAIVFMVYDRKSAYYLVSSIDPDFRNSGSATLLVLRAIEALSAFTDRFDFEGSMIPGVERSFRKLGARQTPYFQITRGSDVRGKLRVLAERVFRRLGLKE